MEDMEGHEHPDEAENDSQGREGDTENLRHRSAA
jgi:hypothetical protein